MGAFEGAGCNLRLLKMLLNMLSTWTGRSSGFLFRREQSRDVGVPRGVKEEQGQGRENVQLHTCMPFSFQLLSFARL